MKKIPIITVTLLVLSLSSCGLIDAFLNPGDLTRAVTTDRGVTLTEVRLSRDYIFNTGRDTFTLTVRAASTAPVTRVIADLSPAGGGDISLANDPADRGLWQAVITVPAGTAGPRTLSVKAQNSLDYAATNFFTITLIDINGIYVSPSGHDTNDGLSAQRPMASVMAAVEKAWSNGIATVLVAQGVYTNRYFNAYCVRLRGGVTVTGGWDSSFTSRDPALYETVLDGANTVVHVVTCQGVSEPATGIDGFTIKGGNASGYFDDEKTGGGLYLRDTGAFVRNCRVMANTAEAAGGGIFAYGHSGSITGTYFISNRGNTGGGVFLYASTTLVSNCGFVHNTADAGAGVYIRSLDPVITHSLCLSNTALYTGGAFYMENSRPSFNSMTVQDNFATINNGSGFYINSSTTVISDSTISGNRTAPFGDGGGIFATNSDIRLISTKISGHISQRYGPGLCLINTSAYLSNAVIISNTITNNFTGAGVFCQFAPTFTMLDSRVSHNSNAQGQGGGLALLNCDNILLSNTGIYNNSANFGAGLRLSGSSNVLFITCLIQSNSALLSGGGVLSSNSTVNITDCRILANTALDNGGGLYMLNSTGIFSHCILNSNTSTGMGGALCLLLTNSITLHSNMFIANRGNSGGALHMNMGKVTAVSNQFTLNHSTSSGGALYLTFSLPGITNLIYGNRFLTNSVFSDHSSIYFFRFSDLILANNQFIGVINTNTYTVGLANFTNTRIISNTFVGNPLNNPSNNMLSITYPVLYQEFSHNIFATNTVSSYYVIQYVPLSNTNLSGDSQWNDTNLTGAAVSTGNRATNWTDW